MTTVQELIPGDEVKLLDRSAIFVSQCTHPIWPSLRLVIWRMIDTGEWFHDALFLSQEIGAVPPTLANSRMANLRWALVNSPRQ